jgi:hypothetical protein
MSLEMMMSDAPQPAFPEIDFAADGILKDEVNRRRAADGLALRGHVPRGVRPMNQAAFTTHVADHAYRGRASATRSTRRWRPLVIATCIGAVATLAGTAVWGFFPDEVMGSMSGLDRAIVSLGSR